MTTTRMKMILGVKMILGMTILTISLNAFAMHVESICPSPPPYADAEVDLSLLPPGHARKLLNAEDLGRALDHPGTLRQLLRLYPSHVIAQWRENPEDLRTIISPGDRKKVLQVSGEQYGPCMPLEVEMRGELRTAVELRSEAPYFVSVLRRLDGREYRMNGLPSGAREDRAIKARGFLVGHDIRVDSVEQWGEVVLDEIWNDFIRPNTATTGITRGLVVGFTFAGSVDTPTVAGLGAMAAQAMVRERENSDPDGPGPQPPSSTPEISVWPAIIDLTPLVDLANCDWSCVHKAIRLKTGWKASTPGDVFHIVGDGGSLPLRWNFGGVNFLNAVRVEDQPVLVNLGASITRAGSGTFNHERNHGFGMHHDEGIGGCMYTLPGLQGLVSPCYLQPYGFRSSTLGSSSTDGPLSPGMQVEGLAECPTCNNVGWVSLSDVEEITGPGRYTIREYRAATPEGLPSVLRFRRSTRPGDWLYISAYGDAPRTPTGARTGVFYHVRSRNRWYEPLAVNCQSESTGHIVSACQVGHPPVVDPISGMRFSLESETADTRTILAEIGPIPTTTTFPPTTTTTLSPTTLIVGFSYVPPLEIGKETTLRAWGRRADETTMRIPEEVEWARPFVSTANPISWTPTVVGWNWIEARVRLDGVWSSSKALQLYVNASTTTSTVSTTSSTSTIGPSTTSSTTNTSSTSSSTPTTSTVTSSTMSTSTTTTSIPPCKSFGKECSAPSECCSRKCRRNRWWWLFGDRVCR